VYRRSTTTLAGPSTRHAHESLLVGDVRALGRCAGGTHRCDRRTTGGLVVECVVADVAADDGAKDGAKDETDENWTR
jgi:hypothetical protein